MDSYGDSNAMLRTHQELKHRRMCRFCGHGFETGEELRLHHEKDHGWPYPDLIMLGWTVERKRALEMGWAPENILGVTVEHLEGRRYSSIHITWVALDIMGAAGSPILTRLGKDQVLMGAKVTLGHLIPPPALLHEMQNHTEHNKEN